jgi:hypothetical protein
LLTKGKRDVTKNGRTKDQKTNSKKSQNVINSGTLRLVLQLSRE